MRRELAAMIALAIAGCGPSEPGDFTVPEHCFAGAPVEIAGIDDGAVRRLHYGPQGGQHVDPGITLRGVDPRVLTVRVTLARDLDGTVDVEQVFTRFVPGLGECDVAIPMTELFVQSRFTDGTTLSGRIIAFHGMTSETREVRGVCVSSTDACGPHPPLELRIDGIAIEDGATVSAPSGSISIEAQASGIVWGRAGTRTIEQRTLAPIVLEVSPGETIELALARGAEVGGERGVLGLFEGAITIAP